MSFFAYYMGAPQVSFFAYYIGAPLRSVSSHAIWVLPQVSFFAHCMGAPSVQFLRILYMGAPSD